MVVAPPSVSSSVAGPHAALINQRNRVNLKTLGDRLGRALGAERHEQYMGALRNYLTAKLSKKEFEGKVGTILGAENIYLHNSLIGALLHNARVSSSLQANKIVEQHKRTVLEENNQKKLHPMGREARGRRRLPQQGTGTPAGAAGSVPATPMMLDMVGGSQFDVDMQDGVAGGSSSMESQIFHIGGVNSLRDLGHKSRRSYELETLLDTQDDVLDIQALKIRIDATAMDHGLDIRRVPVGTAEHSDLDEIGEVMHGSLKALLKNILETCGAWSRARHDIFGDPASWTADRPVRIQLSDLLASMDHCRLMPDGSNELREKILHRLSMHEVPASSLLLPTHQQPPSQDWPWDLLEQQQQQQQQQQSANASASSVLPRSLFHPPTL